MAASLAPSPPHDHDWHLAAVLHEDGRATEEYRCALCGDVTFADG